MPLPPERPKLTRKPSVIKVYRANWAYSAQGDDELSFDEGDLIYISDQATEWWRGTCKGKSGLVPGNYLLESDGTSSQVDFPLQEAAKRGNLEWVNECLENKISINSQDKSGSTALYWASYGGHVEVVDRLLSNKFTDLNLQNKLGDTALLASSIKAHPDVTERLIKKGADSKIANANGDTPLSVANNPQVKSILNASMGLKTARGNDADYIGAESDTDSD